MLTPRIARCVCSQTEFMRVTNVIRWFWFLGLKQMMSIEWFNNIFTPLAWKAGGSIAIVNSFCVYVGGCMYVPAWLGFRYFSLLWKVEVNYIEFYMGYSDDTCMLVVVGTSITHVVYHHRMCAFNSSLAYLL